MSILECLLRMSVSVLCSLVCRPEFSLLSVPVLVLARSSGMTSSVGPSRGPSIRRVRHGA